MFVLFNVLQAKQIFRLPENIFPAKNYEHIAQAERGSSEPYISGDTFRAVCDHILDEVVQEIDVDDIQPGEIIFLKEEVLQHFFDTIYPHIKHPFIIVSHNGDKNLPREYARYLDEDKIIAWFCVNLASAHPKAFGLPIGIANRHWPHGNTQAIAAELSDSVEKSILLCASFVRPTHASRQRVYDYFRNIPYCYFADEKPYDEYLADLHRSKFVLSPRGVGMDCHRTWEAMLMGAIPIVPMTEVDHIYADLPVLIIDGLSWESLTQEFLEEKWQEFQQKKFNLDKLYAGYWLNLIREQARRAKDI